MELPCATGDGGKWEKREQTDTRCEGYAASLPSCLILKEHVVPCCFLELGVVMDWRSAVLRFGVGMGMGV